MDFYRIRVRAAKSGVMEVYPEFQIVRSRYLMVRAKSFVAVWDDSTNLWITDEYKLAELVDGDLREYVENNQNKLGNNVHIRYMTEYSSGIWSTYRSWISKLADNAKPLDQRLVFADETIRREDYASKRLPYSLSETFPAAWDKLIGKLYAPEERAKIEWAIGAVVSGDSKKLQKFLVLYGEKGTGKSTILDIIQMLFKGYYTVFEARALGQSGNQFATESFKDSPLVAIQHDGDLSKIEDNTRLNSIVSHEEMVINEKNKPLYNAVVNAFLFMGTNHPVRITDAKSGIIRRLIDATPTGQRFDINEYELLMTEIKASLGAIANHCLGVYRSMGKNYYRDYVPMSMMQKTDVFYNFVWHHQTDFGESEYVTLHRAWSMYKDYASETKLEWTMPQYKFREALRDYFSSFEERCTIDGVRLRNVYREFKLEKMTQGDLVKSPEKPYSLVLDQETSLLDESLKSSLAQYSGPEGSPSQKWDRVVTQLKDLDTRREHYVIPNDASHIVIDFDLTDEEGKKSAKLNLEAASKFPPTYGEYSKGGSGIHLHYRYLGDTETLSSIYSPGIEIKVFRGKAALRRRVSFCSSTPVTDLPEGFLPLKERKVINQKEVKSEKKLRELVVRALRKEIHPNTTPSISFVKQVLDDAYNSDLLYDLSDMKKAVSSFAAMSSNQANKCLAMVNDMKFTSKGMEPDDVDARDISVDFDGIENRMVFYDVEVFPNLFIVSFGRIGEPNKTMINPTPQQIEALVEEPLVGFNVKNYDNHLLYARYMGASNTDLYDLSSRIVKNDQSALIAHAYNISYLDVYQMASTKQSLKKWQIELGLNHMEAGLPWDQPVKEEDIPMVVSYCENDVETTKQLFLYLHEDWKVRKILSSIANMSPNASSNALSQEIIFGSERNPKFYHTDLSEMFPGYEYKFGKSTYRGEETGEGGYVYAEPGIYRNVALIDVASMHPASLIAMQVFGEYTKNFQELRDARVAIKRGDKETASTLLGGKLAPYLSDDPKDMASLSNALKLVINSVYGMSSAKYPNRCNGRDPKSNPDNIVAKRGALFMIDLKHFVQEKGFTVVHIKTDSIKIADATPEIIEEVMEFGKGYGYEFEHEATYDKIALVNNAVYIAKDHKGWHATGKQFQHPVVFKTLFSKEPLILEDYRETKTVRTSLHLIWKDGDDVRNEFIGRVGAFYSVKKGGELCREANGSYSAATGTKGYLWDIDERVNSLEQLDLSYYNNLVQGAIQAIEVYGSFDDFAREEEE